jgi:hypothetical protein
MVHAHHNIIPGTKIPGIPYLISCSEKNYSIILLYSNNNNNNTAMLYRVIISFLSTVALTSTLGLARPRHLRAAPGGGPLHTTAELGLSDAEYADLPDMPGSNFMMKGFDITNDTVSRYVSNGGETARLPVYKYSYDGKQVYISPYDKTKYRVPDQLSPTVDTQAMEYIVDDISYAFDEVITYETSRFNIGVTLSVKDISASVKYNQAMATASDVMSNKSHVFAGSKKWWKMFDIAAYPTALTGCVDPMLAHVLNSLPATISSDADSRKYFMFVQAWGTHYMINADFGGKLIHNVYIDTDFYMKHTSSWMSTQIDLNFHFDAFAIDGGSFHNRSDIHMDQDYMKHSKSYCFYEGGLPALQKDQTMGQWESTIAQAPHFLNATMGKISDLAENPKIEATLSNYIDLYMKHAGNGPKITTEEFNKRAAPSAPSM